MEREPSTPTQRRSGPLTAIGMTLALGAVLAYCGRVDTPTLVARAAAPDTAAPIGSATDPTTVISTDLAAVSPVGSEASSDPAIGALAVPFDATSAATAGASSSTETATPRAPQVQATVPQASSRPIGPSGSGGAPGDSASAPSPAASSVPTSGGSAATGSSASPTSTSPSASSASSASSAAVAAGATVTTVSGATTTTSPTSTSTTVAASRPSPTGSTSTTSTTSSTTSTVATTTTTDGLAPPSTSPTSTSTPQALGPRTLVDIDFQQGSDAASVGLDALTPGPHGITTDLAIGFGVARARRLDVEVYARTRDLGSADHWVEADLHIGGDIAGNYTGVMTRVSASDAGYAWHKLEVWGSWNGFRLLTLVGSRIADEQYVPYRLQADTTYRIRLEARGSTIAAWVDGQQLFEVTAPTVPWSPTAGINMTASGDPSNSTLDNLRAGPL